MQTIRLNSTRNTPEVLLDPSKGVFKMRGRSYPENSMDFYHPLRSALTRSSSSNRLEVQMQMEYFNTSSSKCIFDLFREMRKMKENGIAVDILWYYEPEDEDMLEVGEDYSELLNLPFSFVEYYPGLSD